MSRCGLHLQIVYLAGDTVTYEQVAGILERVPGRPFKRNVWMVAHLIRKLEKDPTHHIKKYRAVCAQGKGVACSLRHTKLSGIYPRSKPHAPLPPR